VRRSPPSTTVQTRARHNPSLNISRRLAAGVRRPQARCRADQVEDRGVPARGTQAGAVADQDPDHVPADRAARFLGYQIVVLHADHKRDRRGHRSINAGIGLKVLADVLRGKCAPNLHRGRPIRRTERIVDTDFSIVAQFQAEFRGVAAYYRLAFNRHQLGQLQSVMERSLTKTLARKYQIRAAQADRRYRAVLATEHGPRRGLQVTVHRDGGRLCWWRNGAASPWRGTPPHGPSTTTPTHLEQPPVSAGATAPRRCLRKDPHHGHLVGGLLHSEGRRKRTRSPGTSSAAYPTSRRDLRAPEGETPSGYSTTSYWPETGVAAVRDRWDSRRKLPVSYQ
jgi:hypothetical protein